jgi:hypothetical protein
MIQPIVFGRTVAVVAVVLVLGSVACDKTGSIDVAAPAPDVPPDVAGIEGDAKGYAYLPGNDYHDRQIARLLRREDVAAVVGLFAERGLQVSLEKSVTVRGSNGVSSVWATLIALDGGERTAMIACYGSGGRFGIAPVRFATSGAAPGSGWHPFVGKGWYSVPDAGSLPRSAGKWEPFEWWDWGFFGNCMVNRAPEIATSCAFQCFWLPGYWHCFMACTAAEAVGATIACILDMYQWGGNEIKKDG